MSGGFKGAIEAVAPTEVSGWVAIPGLPLRGQTVLAFLDEACIGAGRVEIFREDLADAGIGDGFAGYVIETSPVPANDLGRVTVRLDASDFLLVQPGARVSGGGAAAAAAPARRPLEIGPANLQWMAARGWLSQPDYDLLKFFDRMGVYERALPGAEEARDRPAALARASMELLCLREVEVEKRPAKTLAELRDLMAVVAAEARMAPVLALWCADRVRLGVREGSHAAAEAATGPLVDYDLGPDRLVLVAAGLGFDHLRALPGGGLVAYVGRLA
ncbi:hypothetical protein ACI6QG_11690 [Roseococcus sp. DSY-14]|uniref:hypothetical protein n=1 Tax=Roseococcus sp. DSY-14 TaxID=3369650 RepID=UPI00387B6484